MEKQDKTRKDTRDEDMLPKTPVGFLWYVSRPFQHWMWGALMAVVFASALGQGSYYFFKLIIDAAQSGNLHQALIYGILYPISMLVVQLFWRLSGFFGMRWVTSARKFAYERLVLYTLGHSHS